jgi:glycosyltransferase involved in cell wall biosynthesis
MRDLSILIPARNEQFLAKTIENILENIEADTEVITIIDGVTDYGYPPLNDPRVTILSLDIPIGQRAATNLAARNSTAKFIMKCDAHCSFEKGFDIKLMKDCEYDWTMVPRMYNLHAFDWVCEGCGIRSYQGPKPGTCMKCGQESRMEIVWKNRSGSKSDYMWFDTDLHFRYFDSTCLASYGLDINASKEKYSHRNRDWAQGNITDQMTALGACWMMHRDRYWELEGLDEGHGSWGQMGVEIACKSWLSGGRQVVNKNTWFAHMFRTKDGFSFPYHISNKDQEKAQLYSRDLWKNNKWHKAIHPLSWLIQHFSPLPGWDKETL